MFRRISEKLFVIILLLNSMGIVPALSTSGRGNSNVGSTDLHMPSIVFDGALNLCGAVLVLMHWRSVLRAARQVWPLLALVTLGPLSVAWSIQPLLTLRRSALLAISTVLAIYLGQRFSVDRFARLLAQALCMMILATIVMRFAAPSYVIDYFGCWRGLSGYKNAFGEHMAVAVVVLSLVRFRHVRWLRYLFILGAGVLLLLSHSITSLVTCVLTLAALLLWRLPRVSRNQRWLLYAATASMFVVGSYVLQQHTSQLFQILQRDSSMTGRRELWSLVLPAILKRPILGYGYGAFWGGWRGEALDIRIASGWLPPQADNGYLDLCLSVGLLGLCVFACAWFHTLRRGFVYLKSQPTAIGLWPVSYLCFFVVHSVCESTLFTSGEFSFLVFITIATSVAVNRRPLSGVVATNRRPALMRDWNARARSLQI